MFKLIKRRSINAFETESSLSNDSFSIISNFSNSEKIFIPGDILNNRSENNVQNTPIALANSTIGDNQDKINYINRSQKLSFTDLKNRTENTPPKSSILLAEQMNFSGKSVTTNQSTESFEKPVQLNSIWNRSRSIGLSKKSSFEIHQYFNNRRSLIVTNKNMSATTNTSRDQIIEHRSVDTISDSNSASKNKIPVKTLLSPFSTMRLDKRFNNQESSYYRYQKTKLEYEDVSECLVLAKKIEMEYNQLNEESKYNDNHMEVPLINRNSQIDKTIKPICKVDANQLTESEDEEEHTPPLQIQYRYSLSENTNQLTKCSQANKSKVSSSRTELKHTNTLTSGSLTNVTKNDPTLNIQTGFVASAARSEFKTPILSIYSEYTTSTSNSNSNFNTQSPKKDKGFKYTPFTTALSRHGSSMSPVSPISNTEVGPPSELSFYDANSIFDHYISSISNINESGHNRVGSSPKIKINNIFRKASTSQSFSNSTQKPIHIESNHNLEREMVNPPKIDKSRISTPMMISGHEIVVSPLLSPVVVKKPETVSKRYGKFLNDDEEEEEEQEEEEIKVKLVELNNNNTTHENTHRIRRHGSSTLYAYI